MVGWKEPGFEVRAMRRPGMRARRVGDERRQRRLCHKDGYASSIHLGAERAMCLGGRELGAQRFAVTIMIVGVLETNSVDIYNTLRKTAPGLPLNIMVARNGPEQRMAVPRGNLRSTSAGDGGGKRQRGPARVLWWRLLVSSRINTGERRLGGGACHDSSGRLRNNIEE
eukprot:3663710-Pyramimonas_sp.AAC.1